MAQLTKTTKTRYPQGNLAACLLPWTATFDLEEPLFEEHVQGAIDEGFKDIYLMGTAGEGYALSDRQFQQVVRIFARLTVKPGLRPQVGIISLSMQQVIERIAFGRELGIRVFQISLPSWGALSDAELMTFFTGVCGRYADCQFLHYNLPRTKRVLNGSDYRRIADAVPNLVATKNSTSDYARVADLMRNVPDLQHFFLENGFAFGCLWGECSLLCSYDVLFPNATKAFFEAGRSGDWPTLWRLHKRFNELEPCLFGSIRSEHIDGAFDKTFAWLKDPRFSNSLLPPYHGLSPEENAGVRERFEKHCGDLS